MKRIILLLLFALAGVTTSSMAETLNRVAAIVNNEIISTYQLDSAVAQQAGSSQLDAVQLGQLKSALLERLINDKLLEQRIAELELKVSDPELDAAIQDVQKKNSLTTEMLEQALAAQGLTMPAYREQIRNEILRYKLLGREVNYKVLVTSREVRNYFNDHLDEYNAQPKVQVNRISYPIPADASEQQLADLHTQIKKARKLLAKGKAFDQVLTAQQDMASGGDMGKLVEADLAEPLQLALKDLEPGEVSETVEMNDQLHLFLVTARTSGDDDAFEQAKRKIEERLKREKTDARFKEWEQELRGNAYVDVRI